uniref:Atypical chemokine receptor 2 n=1 Tax=Sphenodon punctatus TaxID=8508 RepID=A0A8D0G6H5_SPHPU
MTIAFSSLPNSTESPESTTSYGYDYLSEEDYAQFVVCKKETVQSFGRVFLPVLYTLVFLLGLVGNLLLFAILVKYTKHKRMTEVYLLNLTVSDLLFVATLPFWAVYAASEWVFGDALCKVISIVYTVNFYSGIFFVSCMSLDKYLEIVHAWSHKRLRTPRKSVVVSSAVWILSILLSAPDLIFVRVQDLHDGKLICNHDYGQHSSTLKILLRFQQNLLGFLLPFLCMVFFYSRIACALTTFETLNKKKALGLVVALVATFFVLWFPYNVVLFLHSLQDLRVIHSCESSKRLDYAVQVTESFAFIHCCLNPLLYAFVNKRFRLYLKKAFRVVSKKRDFFTIQHLETSSSSRDRAAQVEMTSIMNIDGDGSLTVGDLKP